MNNVTELSKYCCQASRQNTQQPEREIRQNYLKQQFGLTSAEAQIGSALLEGEYSLDIAAERRVSLGTLRKQIAIVLAKTNCRTQHQFVATVLNSFYTEHQATGAKPIKQDATRCN